MPVQASVQIFKICINETPRNTEVTAEKITPRVFWVVSTISAL